MDKIIKYHEAQKNKGVRQIFLNNLLKLHPNNSVSRLVYDDGTKFKELLNSKFKKGQLSSENYEELTSPAKKNNGTDIRLAFCARGNIGTGVKSPIFVMPACFRLSFENFCSAIVDHEYIHASHIKEGIKIGKGEEYNYLVATSFNQDTVLDLDESIAYYNTLLKAIEKNNLSDFIDGTSEILEEFTVKLKGIKKFTSVAEESAVKKQIIKNEDVLEKYQSIKKQNT